MYYTESLKADTYTYRKVAVETIENEAKIK